MARKHLFVAALADAEALQAQLKQAQADLKRGATAAKDDSALRAERDRLRRDNQAQQERISTQQTELAAKDKALLAARQAQRAAPASPATPAATPAAPAVAAAAPAAAAALPADGSTLAVAGCGAACPSFVLIPNPGATVLGTGDEAITARFTYRFAMGKTEVTLGQCKAFWAAPDRNYQPVKTDNTHCNWSDAAYAKDDRHPVRCVNTQDAQAYARWFTERYGAQLGLRIDSIGLPTELEWEFSARGGRYTQHYLWADAASKAETCRHAQTDNCPGDVLPVGGRLKKTTTACLSLRRATACIWRGRPRTSRPSKRAAVTSPVPAAPAPPDRPAAAGRRDRWRWRSAARPGAGRSAHRPGPHHPGRHAPAGFHRAANGPAGPEPPRPSGR